MKKIISTYLIFAFMLMIFSGCERIKNSLGLVKPANVENPANKSCDICDRDPNDLIIILTAAAIDIAISGVGFWLDYKEIKLPPVLDRALFTTSLIGLSAALGACINIVCKYVECYC